MVPRQPTVSVIMVAHNADRHLRRAVESLQNQSMRNFELLAVDAASTDRTAQMLDRMSERDIRLSVVHEESDSLSSACNHALDLARGTYVYVMGAADWVEPRLLDDMVELAQHARLDLVVGSCCVEAYGRGDGERRPKLLTHPDALYVTQQEFRAAAWQLFDQGLLSAACNKLYRRDLIEQQRLRYAPISADGFSFVLGYLSAVERVGTLEHPAYHVTSGSLAPVWDQTLYDRREREHGWLLDLYTAWGLSGDAACRDMIQRRYLKSLMGCVVNLCRPTCDLAAKQKLALIERMIASERAQLAVAVVRPRSRAMRALLLPIKSKNARLTYREGKIIARMQQRNPAAFLRLAI